MNDEHRLPPLLLGVFREMQAQGVPVSVRDYLDGIRALRLGFGQGNRERLRELAQALWARSDEERRILDRWFDALSPPPPRVVAEIDEALEECVKPEQVHGGPATPTTAPTVPSGTPDHPGSIPESDATAASPRARVSFAAAHEGGGLPIPRLPVEPAVDEEYVLHPQAVIGERDMAVLWRRYRRSTRLGPRTELDVPSTVRERCRRGLLRQPVLRPRRGNSARLLVLADASASMDPWRPFLETIAGSLRLARLAGGELRYFKNLPRRQLFTTARLADPEPTDEALRRNAGAGLMVVSDAGSARGFLNRRRAMQTAAFLDEALRYFPTVVWLNPMPESRWTGTTAEQLASLTPVTMLPLDAAHVLRAVDVLRGNK